MEQTPKDNILHIDKTDAGFLKSVPKIDASPPDCLISNESSIVANHQKDNNINKIIGDKRDYIKLETEIKDEVHKINTIKKELTKSITKEDDIKIKIEPHTLEKETMNVQSTLFDIQSQGYKSNEVLKNENSLDLLKNTDILSSVHQRLPQNSVEVSPIDTTSYLQHLNFIIARNSLLLSPLLMNNQQFLMNGLSQVLLTQQLQQTTAALSLANSIKINSTTQSLNSIHTSNGIQINNTSYNLIRTPPSKSNSSVTVNNSDECIRSPILAKTTSSGIQLTKNIHESMVLKNLEANQAANSLNNIVSSQNSSSISSINDIGKEITKKFKIIF